jgi:hypothetical protein
LGPTTFRGAAARWKISLLPVIVEFELAEMETAIGIQSKFSFESTHFAASRYVTEKNTLMNGIGISSSSNYSRCNVRCPQKNEADWTITKCGIEFRDFSGKACPDSEYPTVSSFFIFDPVKSLSHL